MASGSKIFNRNRSIGYVSNHVPAVTRYVERRKEYFIITCIGRSFQVYSSNHFRLTHVSSNHPDEITCMAVDKYFTYTASDKCIYAWRAGKHILHVYKGHAKNVHLLLPFNHQLIAVDETNTIKVWDIASEEVYLEIPFSPDEFLITAIAHPPTYINKIIIGSRQGRLKIINIKDSRLIYTFAGHPSKVNCIECAPAIDVVAVGHQDGSIILINIKYDEVLMEFKQDWGPVTQIAFRLDNHPIMATSSINGHIAFWNLEEKRITNQIQAHEDTITTITCFACEPLMLTTSPDNSMKLWAFDMPDGGARLLRERGGHTAPPLYIRYHGSRGTSILSSGDDSSMRIFSTVSETLNRSAGKASYNRKSSKKKNRFQIDNFRMPPIIKFTSETTREKEWDSIAAIHLGLVQVTTWSFDKCRMGDHHLVPEQFQNKNRKDFKTEATCLALTHCGNFVIIGYSNGSIERFNIQSGLHRATYGSPAHKHAIRGIACDNLNQIVISGCSDGQIKFWNFKGNLKEAKFTMKVSNGIEIMCSHVESAMVAIAFESYSISILDAETQTIVRNFEGHTGKINDITFSPDSRWLITAAMDSTIKIWDIPSGYMVDHFKVERPCISLSMSPTGDFLATAHINHLGIFLWSNKMLYNQITLRSINPFNEAPYVDLPSNIRDTVSLDMAIADMTVDDDEGDEINFKYTSPSQLSDDLITLSGLAASRWHNLLNLDIIKKRNKPKAPPKVPKQAPFFLPTIAGLEFKFDTSVANNEDEDKDMNSKILVPDNFTNLTTLGKLLEETQNENYQNAINHLKKLGPSMIDFEIKSLHPIGGGSYLALVQFLKAIEFMFKSNIDFELCQAYLSVFLQAHGLKLIEKPELVNALVLVEKAQNKTWKALEDKLFYNLGVVSSLRNYSLDQNS